MVAGVRADISLVIDAVLTGTGDLGDPKVRTLIEEALQWRPGTDAVGKANVLFADQRTLAASANEDIDLAGVLANAFGTTITAAELMLLYVKAAAGNTNNVNVTRPASNGVPIFLAAGDGVAVKPGQFFLFVDQLGTTITASNGDLVNIANSSSGTGVTYDILAIGRTSAA